MWQTAQTLFLSIILEALPFVLLGVIVSSLIQELISRERMLRLLPKNRTLSVVIASLLGLVLPVCDCGTIPVARSFLKKGVPLACAMTFTLAAPVINPITMIATYVAFGLNASMMWSRVAATFGISVLVGWTLLYLERKRPQSVPFRHTAPDMELPMLETAATAVPQRRRTPWQVVQGVLNHAIIEFFEVGVFVVLSAFVAAALQTMVPTHVLASVGEHPILSVLAMMLLAVLLSLCSEADAFVARSLSGLTTSGGVLSFLVIGQMIDMRNLFLLPRTFPSWAVRFTYLLVILLTLSVGIAYNFIF
jgi:uncharacterized membrane protein YraQ (UPF0718 family)